MQKLLTKLYYFILFKKRYNILNITFSSEFSHSRDILKTENKKFRRSKSCCLLERSSDAGELSFDQHR